MLCCYDGRTWCDGARVWCGGTHLELGCGPARGGTGSWRLVPLERCLGGEREGGGEVSKGEGREWGEGRVMRSMRGG